MILVNLLALRTTVLVAEWALTHREWIVRGKAYAPVIVIGFVAYFVGVVIGHAIVS